MKLQTSQAIWIIDIKHMTTFALSSPAQGTWRRRVSHLQQPQLTAQEGCQLTPGQEEERHKSTQLVHVCSRSRQQPPAWEPNTQPRAAAIVLTRALWIRAGPELGDCKQAELLWSAAVRSIVCRGAGSWSQSGYEEGTARKLHTHSGSREEGGSTW